MDHVPGAGEAGDAGGDQQRQVVKALEQPGAEQAAAQEAADDQAAQREPPHLQGHAAQQVTEPDAEIGEHPAQVGGADDCATERGGHRVLQPAGRGCRENAPGQVLSEQRDRRQQQERFQQQYHAIAQKIKGAEQSQMFGKPCYKVNGKAFVCFFEECMVFKLTGTVHEKAMALIGAVLFDPSKKKRPMKEWVQVPYAHSAEWGKLAKAALEYVSEK